MSRKRNLWRGLTTLTASLLTVSVAAGPVVDSYRTDIDKFLGTKSSAMVTDSTDEDLYTHDRTSGFHRGSGRTYE